MKITNEHEEKIENVKNMINDLAISWQIDPETKKTIIEIPLDDVVEVVSQNVEEIEDPNESFGETVAISISYFIMGLILATATVLAVKFIMWVIGW